ncbi:MAG: STAS domain-containing protein [Actinobacteria bacterium]|nr:STAS domain-containing protein [Actinomycetota bacterium]
MSHAFVEYDDARFRSFGLSIDLEAPSVAVTGALDLATGRLLVDAVDLASSGLDAAGHAVTVDLRDLEFLDAAGIGSIIAARNSARTRRSTVRVDAHGRIERILLIAGAASLLHRATLA